MNMYMDMSPRALVMSDVASIGAVILGDSVG
jgi:hypothetical protein